MVVTMEDEEEEKKMMIVFLPMWNDSTKTLMSNTGLRITRSPFQAGQNQGKSFLHWGTEMRASLESGGK